MRHLREFLMEYNEKTDYGEAKKRAIVLAVYVFINVIILHSSLTSLSAYHNARTAGKRPL